MRTKRIGGALVLVSAIALVAPMSAARADGTNSEATAVELSDGESGVEAGSTSADESGSTSASAGSAGDQSMGGEAAPGEQQQGSAIDTDDHNEEGQYGRAALMPWEADGTSGEASAAALLIRIDDPEGNEGIALELLSSESSASAGQSSARSDFLVLRLGGEQLAVRLLHAEADSAGSGAAWLVAVNDNHVATNEDSGGSCVIEIPDAMKLTCLSVEAVPNDVVASVAAAQDAEGNRNAALFKAAAAGSPTFAGTFGETDFAPVDSGTFGGPLARTGEEALMRGLVALALLVAGLAAWTASRESEEGTMPRPRALR